jgi:hypothetical protein
MLDLAAALRAHGVEVVRVTRRPESLGRRVRLLLERPLFHRQAYLDATAAGPLDAVAVAAVTAPGVVDVQGLEAARFATPDLRGTVADPRCRLAASVDPAVLVDKSVQAAVARSAGVGTPETFPLPYDGQFPVVVKTPRGSGGSGVRIVGDAAELVSALGTLSTRTEGEVFLQGFHALELSVGGVALDGALLALAVYRGTKHPDDPTGPSASIVAVDDPRAVASTQRFVGALGFTGFFNINWVLDDDGEPLLIDFNPRVYGSWVLGQELGAGLLEAYLHVLGLGPVPAPGPWLPGRSAAHAVPSPPASATREQAARWRADARAVVRERSGWLGTRWGWVMRSRIMLAAARRLV